MSGTGSGVIGTSTEGSGGDFSSMDGAGVSAESDSGVAVHAISRGNRAAVFESGTTIAQINLVPLKQTTGIPELPKNGVPGDLLLIQNTVNFSKQIMSDSCSLWLCVPGPLVLGGNAFWQEVKLGTRVKGTLW
jgi:hypothetical protein